MSNLYGEVDAPPKPTNTTTENPRCACGKLLAELVTSPWRIRCRHCKTVNGDDVEFQTTSAPRQVRTRGPLGAASAVPGG